MQEYPLEGASPKSRVHTVEVEFRDGEFTGTLRQRVKGVDLGSDVLEVAITTIEEGDYKPEDEKSSNLCTTGEDGRLTGLRLYDGKGGVRVIDQDIPKYVAGARIVAVGPEPEEKETVYTIAVDLQNGRFKGSLRQRVACSFSGSPLLVAAVCNITNGMYEPEDDESRKCCYFEEGEFAGVRLYDDAGNERDIDDPDTLRTSIVGMRIVAVEPEAPEEV